VLKESSAISSGVNDDFSPLMALNAWHGFKCKDKHKNFTSE
jgi:hypothetical protein